ncbi:MAG: glycosyltransferase family 2 protein [Longimicrobiales bacterium]
MTVVVMDGVEMTLVVPCYNENELLETTVPPLFSALAAAIESCELILVDNGSTDGTGQAIERLCRTDPRIRSAVVHVNRGYGLGVLTGYAAARGRCIGHIPADGPVTPEDVAALAQRALREGAGAMVTAVRRDRQETLARKVVSRTYNTFFLLLFGRYTPDINGTPKFLHAVDVDRMRLMSTDYFLEAEMMIKARRLGLRTVPVDVLSQGRPGGQSKVSARLIMACTEFVLNLLRARFGRLPDSSSAGSEPRLAPAVQASASPRSIITE